MRFLFDPRSIFGSPKIETPSVPSPSQAQEAEEAAAREAEERQRQAAGARRGRRATLLTGGGAGPIAGLQTARRTLLGG